MDEIITSVGLLKLPALLELRSKLESSDQNFLQKLATEIRGSSPNEALDLIISEIDFSEAETG